MNVDEDSRNTLRGQPGPTLRLHRNLIFTPQNVGDEHFVIIEDPTNSKFHRIGRAEYAFVSLLDGRTSVAEALRLTADIFPEHAITEKDAAAICNWLVGGELAYFVDSQRPSAVTKPAPSAVRGRGWRQANPIVFRVPLFHPDRLFAAILPWFGWIHSRRGLAVWLVTTLAAMFVVLANWRRFIASSEGILAPSNWLWLLFCYVLLKVLHEVSHGIACKRSGGSIREAGLIMILLAPVAYVDVTSCWRFRSKWARIQTATAGVYIELFMAALAALVWNATEVGGLNQACYNVVVMASLMTVVVNANPLMRFDGYYALSDLIEIPNLYSSGQQYLQYWARRLLLGMRTAKPAWSRSRGLIITLYGVATLCWRVAVLAGLIIAAATWFHGVGIIFACIAAVMWFGLPFVRFLRFLFPGKKEGPGNQPHRAPIAALLAFGMLVLLMTASWPWRKSAPAVVEFEPLTSIRADTSGVVTELRVRSGQYVREGEVVARLSNDELKFELAKLNMEIDQSDVNCRIFNEAHKTAAYQAELQHLESLRKKRVDIQSQVDQLVVRARRNGTIIGRNVQALVGTYLNEGSEIAAIGNEQCKVVRFSIAQDDFDAFVLCIAEPINVRISGRTAFRGRLDSVEPRATLFAPHPALCASMGGPLTVRRNKLRGERASGAGFLLIAPRFTGTVKLSSAQSTALKAGQIGTVSLPSSDESIGSRLFRLANRWVANKIRRGTDGGV